MMTLDNLEGKLCATLDLVRAARGAQGEAQAAILKAVGLMLREAFAVVDVDENEDE